MSTMINILQSVFDIETSVLIDARNKIGQSYVDAIELLMSLPPKGRVVLFGTGKSGHIARKISATFSSTGTPSFFVHPNEAGHGDLGMLCSCDIAILISQSGSNDDFVDVLSFLKRNNIPTIGMTAGTNSFLAQSCDIIISTWVKQEACPLELAPTSSTTLTLVIGDSLAVALMKLKGFSVKDFANTHPFGALGKKLFTKVTNLMVDYTDSPIVSDDTMLFDALAKMNECGMGALIMVDSENLPLGVFTDGDLRRGISLSNTIINVPLKTMINEQFIVIQENDLAVNAVTLIDENEISFLPVVNKDGKIVGSINLRILLNNKIV